MHSVTMKLVYIYVYLYALCIEDCNLHAVMMLGHNQWAKQLSKQKDLGQILQVQSHAIIETTIYEALM